MQIRKADLSDAETFLRFRIAMRTERDTGFDQTKNDFIPNTLRFFEKNIASGDFVLFFMEDGDTVVAISAISVYETPPTQRMKTGRMAYLSSMYTLPEYRKKGLASQLLDRAVKEAVARGCDKVTLNASPMGRSLYLKYGFKDAEYDMTLMLR